MISDILININKIIERDSKVTTYKFALLRGVIDIIQDNSPYTTVHNGRVYFPTGLLIEKWLLYYYPILESSENIPQIYGTGNLAFEKQLKKIIDYYRDKFALSAFYNDLRNKGIPVEIQSDFINLVKQMQFTITDKPMRYIGRSISNEFYSIFHFENGRFHKPEHRVDVQYLIRSCGTFSIPHEYHEAFQVLGSFISGQDSILFKWAEFSVNASGQQLALGRVVNEVLRNPITERDIRESRQIYQSVLNNSGKVYCVWTGRLLNRYAIDHVIPFSILKNNDLWNLLPAHPATNNRKRDKIPSPQLIENRKEIILHYWNLISGVHPVRFRKEIQVSLLGTSPYSDWKETALHQLESKCNYLITSRGFEEWEYQA